MGLKAYKEKRDFKKTEEPVGEEKKTGKLRFVIQKHWASHLHYDFRLEMDGVLKSWAIPKGISLNPLEKRLAMQVEDHPIEYGSFEGIIPAGNYGAGVVMLWDEGFYSIPQFEGPVKELEKKMLQMLEQGNLKFSLEGQKVSGGFALVKIHGKGKRGNEWLLIKKKDAFSTDKVTDEENRSVKSNRTFDEIRRESGEKTAVCRSSFTKEAIFLNTPETEMPHVIKPMMATLISEPFDDKDWLFEIKWDGYRILAELENKKVNLYSRNKVLFNRAYPVLLENLKALDCRAIFDGELVVLDSSGIPSFQLIQNYKSSKEGILVYYIFDLLYLDGHDLSKLPLLERKKFLKSILPESNAIIRFSDHVMTLGKAFYRQAIEKKLEGIIAKRADSVYLPGKRGQDWLKIKIVNEQEAVIAGYTEPRQTRKWFGALVLGVYEGKDLVYIGHTGGGFDENTLQEVHEKMKPLEINKSPFKIEPKTNMPVHWVKPELVAAVKFQEWTEEGSMRQPIFLGLRIDKDPLEVVREIALDKQKTQVGALTKMRDPISGRGNLKKENKKEKKVAFSAPVLIKEENFINQGKDTTLQIGEIILKVSNLNKIFWPKEGYTKRDVVEYYEKIAAFILPYLKNRAESLKRTPNGILKEGFFQKNMPKNIPGWLKTEEIFSVSNNAIIKYLICDDKATLLYMANLGCIEINPWHSTIDALEYPDYAVIDLDPREEGMFDLVVEVALAVKEILEKGGVVSYPKTSGSRGMHIYIPLGKKYTYEEGRKFVQVIVNLVNKWLPGLTSLERTPSKRQNPVYLDYLQNARGQTIAAPYCIRPKPGAMVSTPLNWEEIKPGLSPAQFTIKTIFKRLEQVGDIFTPVLSESIDMQKCLEKLLINT